MRTRFVWMSWAALVALALVPAGSSSADTGVLIPWSVSTEPDDSVLAMRSMDVRVVIEDQHAQVRIDQVFENLTGDAIEGKYVLPLGERATLSSFSLWEGDSRHVGTIISKKKGRQLYDELTREEMDPGLAETGDEEEAGMFSIRVSPIPAYGTSRISLTYEQELDMASLSSQFLLPLEPRRYDSQQVGELSLSVEVKTAAPIAEVKLTPQKWWEKQQPKAGATAFKMSWKGKNVDLAEDVAIEWTLQPPAGGVAARLLTYRDVRPRKDRSPFGGATYVDETGFFLARAVFDSQGQKGGPPRRPPRDLVVLVDTSISMQWDKLDVVLRALDQLFAERMGAEDRFELIAFHDEVRPLAGELRAADATHIAAALAFVRKSTLGGGTDLAGALDAAAQTLAKAPREGAERLVVLLTDGHPTWGEVAYKALADRVERNLKPAKLFVLGIGDDVNHTLLGLLASRVGGLYTPVSEAGDPAFVLRGFFDKMGKGAYVVTLALPDEAKVTDVYPVGGGVAWDGSDAAFFGRYANPVTKGQGSITGRTDDGRAVAAHFAAALADRDEERPWVARGWASLRIRDLLDRIRTDGEKDEWVEEIVALSKRFVIATPYTSFIAAPRALLRPRNFQAGDPLLRVKTGPDIVAVTAMFPFGLTKALEYVPDEDVWETRFLAPVTMTDGSYECTLILTDVAGRRLREVKSFTVDSRPPEVELELSAGAVRGGDTITVTARADQDTRTIRARLGDGPAVDIRWSQQAKASVGELRIPIDLPPGRHEVHVVAEDFAHNTSHTSATLVVVGN
jgi:Ca-activated chloride channel family protein